MLKPVNKNVVLQKEKTENTTASGIILSNEKEDKNSVATVIAVSKEASIEVKAGMKVVYKEYAGTTVTEKEEEYIVVEEKDIVAIIE